MKKQKTRLSQKNAFFALLTATLALGINFWAWSLLSPLGTKYASELSLTPINLSLLLAVPVVIGSLGRIIIGMITDKLGGKIVFAALCFLTSLPVFALTLASSFNELLLVALVLGLGGTSFVVGIPFLSSWFAPERRGFVLGLYSLGNAGTALSGFATPGLSESLGRDTTFYIVALLLLVTSVIFITLGKNGPGWKASKGSTVLRLKHAANTRLTWDLASVYVITFGAFVAFGVYLPVLLKVWYGLSYTDAASRAGGFILLATVARPIGGWLSDKIGGKNVVQFSLLAVVLLAAFVAMQSDLRIHATVAYLSLAFILGCGSGAVFALVGRLSKPDVIGSTTGIVGAAGGLGGFLPPLILAATYQKTNTYAPALVMLSVSALVVLIYIHFRFKDKNIYKSV